MLDSVLCSQVFFLVISGDKDWYCRCIKEPLLISICFWRVGYESSFFFVLPQLHLLSFRAPCLTVNAASEQWHLVAWRRTKNLYCYECLHQYALCRNSVLWPNNLFGVSLSRPCYAGFEEKSSNRYPHWIHSSCYPVEFSYFLSSTRGWRGWCNRMFCIEKIAGGHP